MAAVIQHPNSSPERQREQQGWRRGRPEEDPEKLKPWGFVTAKPSEYLVHVRRGRLLERSSGQGATCFKWPWDAVAVVPTSLQQLKFVADQVTAERVGVEVSGFAVYRIADPLLAYRVLNFSYPERAQEKLEETLTEMFIGGCRRLIANLSVDDCLSKRKQALAQELLREVAPVVGGRGTPADGTAQGWGVVVDTIEIQEVRVLSEKVFAAMQAPYRAALEQRAGEARVYTQKEIAAREAGARRDIEEARLQAEAVIQERKREAERVAAEAQASAALRKSELYAAQSEADIAAKQRVRELEAAASEAEARARSEERIRAMERARAEAEAELAAHALRAQALAQQSELARADAALQAELRHAASESALHQGRSEAQVAMAMAQVEERRVHAQAELVRAQKLPELAAAIGQRIGEVRIAQVGGTENPFGSILQAVTAVMELVQNQRGALAPPEKK